MLEKQLTEWVEKVVKAHESYQKGGCVVDTYKMIVDVDTIIAEAFKHLPVIDKD